MLNYSHSLLSDKNKQKSSETVLEKSRDFVFKEYIFDNLNHESSPPHIPVMQSLRDDHEEIILLRKII